MAASRPSSEQRTLPVVAPALAVAVVGVIVLIGGWVGMRSQDIFAAQLPWLVSGGFLGLGLLGLSGVLASIALRRSRAAQELAVLDECAELVRVFTADPAALRRRAQMKVRR